MRAMPDLSRLSLVLGCVLGTAACGGGKPPPFVIDGGVDTAVDTAVESDAALDSALDADASDADVGDGGPPVDCVFGTAMTLLSSVDAPLAQHVPYGAAANVAGLLVAAPARTPDAYPNYERLGVLLAVNGDVFSATNLGNAATVTSPSSAMSIAHSGSGFLTMFDEGTPSQVFVRAVNDLGTAQGSATPVSASAAGQTRGRILQTSSGFVAYWSEDGDPRLAVLNASGVIVGSPSDPTATIGTPNAVQLYTIGGAPRIAYVDGLRVSSIGIGSNGAVTGSEVTLTAQDGSANFSVAGGPSSAAIVYEANRSVGTSIVFRSINSTGAATIAERSITAIDDRGQRPVIAPLAGGYLVLFRYDPAVGNETLRLATVSSNGDVLGTLDLIDAFPSTTSFTLAVAPDGGIYVAFQENTTVTVDGGSMLAGTNVRALKIVCE